jgi:hypothetical protein
MGNNRDNSAIIFPNFAKKKETHPDYRGSGTVGGVRYEISAWEKQGARTKFLSIAFSVEGTRAANATTTAPARGQEQTAATVAAQPEPEENQPFIA